jgi:polar amino acid transport system permease protein
VSLDANQIITPLAAAILGLGLNEAAYMSEIVRAGIQSIDQGQGEAAGALGMSRIQTLTRVILPQAMRVIIPPTGNEFIGMLKMTSLVSVLAVPELLYSAQIIYSKNLQVVPLLLVASIWYIIVTTVFSVGQGYLERHFARGTSRSAPPTAAARLRKFFTVHSAQGSGKAGQS